MFYWRCLNERQQRDGDTHSLCHNYSCNCFGFFKVIDLITEEPKCHYQLSLMLLKGQIPVINEKLAYGRNMPDFE